MNSLSCFLFSVFLSVTLVVSNKVVTKQGAATVIPRGSSPTVVASPQVVSDPCVGRIAFFSSRDLNGNGEIYIMNSDGTGQTRLTNHSAIDSRPSWSPDGARIAFQSDRDNLANGRTDIYTMKADGTDIVRLTTNPSFDDSPVWSPDGTKIAFLSARDDPNNNIRQLYLMNADGSGQIAITVGSSVQNASWSPDSNTIAFSAYPGDQPSLDIFTVKLNPREFHRLTSDLDDDSDPAWSPDGQQIAYTHVHPVAGQRPDIFVMNTDATNKKNLTNSSDRTDTNAAWSPDGSAIAFSSAIGFESQEVFLMYPDGSGPTNLTNNPSSDIGPAWQPMPSAAPCLLTEPGTDHAVAFDSVNLTRDPFTVNTTYNFSQDHFRRVGVFAKNIKLLPGEGAPAFTARVEDGQHRIVPLTVEFAGQSSAFPWLTQINLKLTDEVRNAGDLRVSITYHSQDSNKPFFSMASEP